MKECSFLKSLTTSLLEKNNKLEQLEREWVINLNIGAHEPIFTPRTHSNPIKNDGHLKTVHLDRPYQWAISQDIWRSKPINLRTK